MSDQQVAEASEQNMQVLSQQEIDEIYQQVSNKFAATQLPIASAQNCMQKCKTSFHYDRLSNADQACLRNCFKKFHFAFALSTETYVTLCLLCALTMLPKKKACKQNFLKKTEKKTFTRSSAETIINQRISFF